MAGHSEDVTCVVLTGRGRFAVTGGLDGTAQVWDMQAQDVVNHEVHDGKVRARCFRGRKGGFTGVTQAATLQLNPASKGGGILCRTTMDWIA